MHINDWLEQFKAVAVNAGGCIKRVHITVAVAPLMILNSTTRRHSMTTITLGTPSSTGFSGDLAHGLLAGIARPKLRMPGSGGSTPRGWALSCAGSLN